MATCSVCGKTLIFDCDCTPMTTYDADPGEPTALASTLADDLANGIALERSRDLTSDADDDPRFSL